MALTRDPSTSDSSSRTSPSDSTSIDDAIDEIEQKEDALAKETEQTEVAVADAELSPALPLKVAAEQPRLTRKKKILIALVVLLVLVGIVIAVPFLRYGFLGVFIKKSVALSVVDSASGRPVSGVKVTMGRNDTVTDQKGVAYFQNMPVGEYFVSYEKKNYNTTKSNILVPILKNYDGEAQRLAANGRTVELKFVDSISGAVVKNVTAATEGANTTVDDSGIVSMVFTPNPTRQSITAKSPGYNDLSTTIDTSLDGQQAIKLVPSGRVYFLSKRTGVISVMSAQLDGSDPREVVRGTGKETDETSLLSSPDWRYAMLISRRDGDRLRMYSINLIDGTIKVADDRMMYFDPIGWAGGKFYYRTTVENANNWTDKAYGLASYTPASAERRTVDETVGMGTSYTDYASEMLHDAHIIGDTLVYVKYWSYGTYYAGDRNRPVSFMTVAADTGARAVLRQMTIANVYYGQSILKSPTQALFGFTKSDSSLEAYQYQDGKLTKVTTQASDFDVPRRFNYIMSPDGSKVLWMEPRDGRTVVFVANRDLTGQQELSRQNYLPYGWVGNAYVLYSKDQSQLFIAPVVGPIDGSLKVADYHKPTSYPGYGYGYGAQ